MSSPRSQKAGFHTVTMESEASIPIRVPNDVIDGDGFYVSYNDVDAAIYGSDTTALVIGQMQAFYILDGNHMAAYAPLIEQGLEACLGYFASRPELVNAKSDAPPASPAP